MKLNKNVEIEQSYVDMLNKFADGDLTEESKQEPIEYQPDERFNYSNIPYSSTEPQQMELQKKPKFLVSLAFSLIIKN